MQWPGHMGAQWGESGKRESGEDVGEQISGQQAIGRPLNLNEKKPPAKKKMESEKVKVKKKWGQQISGQQAAGKPLHLTRSRKKWPNIEQPSIDQNKAPKEKNSIKIGLKLPR